VVDDVAMQHVTWPTRETEPIVFDLYASGGVKGKGVLSRMDCGDRDILRSKMTSTRVTVPGNIFKVSFQPASLGSGARGLLVVLPGKVAAVAWLGSSGSAKSGSRPSRRNLPRKGKLDWTRRGGNRKQDRRVIF
jgi:hypothetical protein